MKRNLKLFIIFVIMLFVCIGSVNAAEHLERDDNSFDFWLKKNNTIENSKERESRVLFANNFYVDNILDSGTEYNFENVVSEDEWPDDIKYVFVGLSKDEYNILNEIRELYKTILDDNSTENMIQFDQQLSEKMSQNADLFNKLNQRIKSAQIQNISYRGTYVFPSGDYEYYALITSIDLANLYDGELYIENTNDAFISSVIYELYPKKVKKDIVTTTVASGDKQKSTVKNPKTGDTLFKILGAITLAGAGFVVTVKKAKQK